MPSDPAVAPPDDATPDAVKTSLLHKLDAWGSSPFPPMGLAALVVALHTRPLQPFPLLFAPALFFAGYVNVAGYAVDAAGMTAAWSGLYALLSLRRRRGGGGAGPTLAAAAAGAGGSLARGVGRAVGGPVGGRVLNSVGSRVLGAAWTPAAQRTSSRRMDTAARRAVRAAAIGLGTVNAVAGGVTYGLTGDRAKEAAEREARNRWGS